MYTKEQKDSVKKSSNIIGKEFKGILKEEYCSSEKEEITINGKKVKATKNTISMTLDQVINELLTVCNNLRNNEEFINCYKDKEEIIIKNININSKELENFGYLFRNDCFDMVINIDKQDLILSNEKTKEQVNEYIKSLSEFYNISSTTIDKELLSLDEIKSDNILQIIPNKKENKFEKESLTLLSINA